MRRLRSALVACLLAPGSVFHVLFIIRGVPRWRDRFPQYGIKVSYWGSGSGTLKIVIPVENHPQKPEYRLAYYHPLCGLGLGLGLEG